MLLYGIIYNINLLTGTKMNKFMNEKKTVLIIDTDHTIRNIIRDYLLELGYAVILSADGLEGMHILEQKNIDLLIVDLDLPYVSGLGLVKIAKEIRTDFPIICMSKLSNITEKIPQQKSNDIILTKPFDLNMLSKSIGKLIK